MLRRNSSKKQPSRPLGRSKSTSAIYHPSVLHLSRFDPVIAERDAHIAARLSFYKAQGRYSEGMASNSHASGFPLVRSGSTVSRHSLSRSESQRSRPSEATVKIKRQQSIRFAGQNTPPRGDIAPRASEQHLPTTDCRLRGPLSHGHLDRVHSQSKARGSVSHIPIEDPVLALALEPTIKRYTAEDDVASIPSSYRKLRKSKSMFTTSYQLDNRHQSMSSQNYSKWTGTKTSRYNALNKENRILPSEEPTNLRAPKSMSFLRSRQELPVIQSTSRAQNDLAVQLARDTFRQQVEQQSRLKSHPSQFFRSKTRRMDGSFGIRRSLRDSSNSSGPLPFTFSGETLAVPKQGTLRHTARKVSKTLKSKIKGFFNRKSSQDNSSNPEGEHAHSQHSEDEVSHHIEGAHLNEKASMSQGASRVASLHAVSSSQHIRSCRGSIESCDWEDAASQEEKSRVTSWTDSLTNTLGSQSGFGDREWQRLSVIKENGMHTSMKPTSYCPSPSSRTAPGKDGGVDSQLIYSALVSRANGAMEKEKGTQNYEIRNMRKLGKGPSRSSSIQLNASEWSPPTIRCVSSEDDDVFQDKSYSAKQELHMPEILKGASTIIPYPESLESSAGSDPEEKKSDAKKEDAQLQRCGKAFIATSQDGGSCRSKMVDRSSAFFASPSSHLFRTTSPFRRALRENMCAAKRSGDCRPTPSMDYLGSLSAITLPPRQPSSHGSPKLGRCEDIESIYSPSAAGGSENHWKDVETSTSAARLQEPPSLPPCIQNSYSILSNPTEDPWACENRREVSGVSSVEWKASLSADVARLETITATRETTPEANAPARILGNHVRERTEIECSPDSGSSPLIAIPPGMRDKALEPAKDNTASPIEDESIDRQVDLGFESELHRNNEQPKLHANLVQLMNGSDPSQRDQLYLRRRPRNRSAKDTQSPAKSSPGLTRAVERQFGKTMVESPKPWEGRPVKSLVSTPSPVVTPSSICGRKPQDSESAEHEAQVLGSKRMVELFLNSRKRETPQLTPASESECSPAIFL